MIHSFHAPYGVCIRKDSNVDVTSHTCKSGTVVTRTSVAFFAGNITCPTCKQWKHLSDGAA